jgi:GNAT superfamily N-acetyltransferase
MLKIRVAELRDAERITRLLVEVSEEFVVHEFSAAGRAHLLRDMSMARVQQRLAGAYRFYLAEAGEALAGVAAVREPDHLYYLFVAKPFHRTGVARALWSRVMREHLAIPLGPKRMTVNASNHAVVAYERLGFRRCGPQAETMGVLYKPMEYQVDR